MPVSRPVFLNRLSLSCALLCFLAAAINAQNAGDDAAREAYKKRYSDYLDMMDKSESLRWDTTQIQAWSRCQGDDVLPRLLQIYDKPPANFETNVPYLTAAAILQRHDAPAAWPGTDYIPPRVEPSDADVKALRKFLKSHIKSEQDIWGVYCAGCVLALEHDPDINMELLEYIGASRTPAVNRAALLEGLSRAGFDALRRVLEVMLEEKFKGSNEDAVLLESICWAAARAYKPLHKDGVPVLEEWRGVFDGILERLEHKKVLQRSLREAALALQYCFKTRKPYQYASMWRLQFETGKDPLGDDDGKTVANFMGLDVLGQRVLFLIDASDSMLNPLSDEDKDAIRNPITQDKKDKKKGNDEHEINWDRVKTRFDAAREHVKWTLSRLDKDKQVAVILFGDKAEPLSFTRGFIDCTSGNVKKINATLDAVRASEAPDFQKDARPYGVLMGDTNYYEALLTAYRLGRSGLINSPREHWDLKLVQEGADSIFLLSDGAPIRDGFKGNTPDIEYEYDSYQYFDSKQPGEGEWVDFPGRPATEEREVEVRDPETGNVTTRKVPGMPAVPPSRKWRQKVHVKSESQWFDDNGPYASRNATTSSFSSFELTNLLAEVERMNLVRRVQIHCVGIGEAKMNWLKPIATQGRGQAVFFGKDKETDPSLPDGIPGMPNPEDD